MNASLIIVMITSLTVLQSCDLFESRDPQSPSEPKSSYRVPVEPSDVIDNIKNAFIDKNANDYKKNFSSGQPVVDRDFYFLPSSNVIPYFPPDWNIGSEFQYFNNLVITVPENNPINVSFTNEEYDVQGDSAIYSSTYSISVPVLNSVPIIYGGSTKFIMITDQNSVWVIYYWEDIAQQGFKSWSELKYEFSQ